MVLPERIGEESLFQADGESTSYTNQTSELVSFTVVGTDSMTFNRQVSATWLDDGRRMRLDKSVIYVDSTKRVWIAPTGSIVDGASIPRFFWRFIGGPFSGKYRRASVIHDVCCQNKDRPSVDVHDVFYDMMIEDGVSNLKALLMWTGVCLFGPKF